MFAQGMIARKEFAEVSRFFGEQSAPTRCLSHMDSDVIRLACADDVLPAFRRRFLSPTSAKGAIIDHEPHPLREPIVILHRRLLAIVRDDAVCRRLMTTPGVGPVVALTYRATVPVDPGTSRGSSMKTAQDQTQ